MRMAKTETRLVGPNAAGLGLISPLSSSALSSTKGPDILLIDFLRPPPTGGPPTLFFLSFFFSFFPIHFAAAAAQHLGRGRCFLLKALNSSSSLILCSGVVFHLFLLFVCVCVCVCVSPSLGSPFTLLLAPENQLVF